MYTTDAIKKRRKTLTGSDKPGFLGGLEASADEKATFSSILDSMQGELLRLEEKQSRDRVSKTKEQIARDLAYTLVRVPWWFIIEEAILSRQDGLRILFKHRDLWKNIDQDFILSYMIPLVHKALRYTRNEGKIYTYVGDQDHWFDCGFSIYLKDRIHHPRFKKVEIKPYTKITRLQTLCLVLLMRKVRAFPEPIWKMFSFKLPHPPSRDDVRFHENICGALRLLARLPSRLCRYAIEFL